MAAAPIPGLGPASSRWLRSAGIDDIAGVARIGVLDTCELLLKAGHPVSLNMAYALQAALMGTRWNRLPDEVRDQLRAGFEAMRARRRRPAPGR
jgi:hypothetical protein